MFLAEKIPNGISEYEHPDEPDQTKPIKLKIGETSKGNERQEIVSGVEILFPNVVGTSPLESSDLTIDDELADPGRASKLRPKTPELDDEQELRFAKRDSHLTGSKLEGTNAGPIHVTKVLDSPVTATLMARGCLPDIGLPLCAGHQAPSPKPATEEDELTRSESHGTPEPKKIAENKLDFLQDSTFLRKLYPLVAEYNSSRAKLDMVREPEIKPVNVKSTASFDTLCKISSLEKWQLVDTLLNNLNVKDVLRRLFTDLLLPDLSDKPPKKQDARSERTKSEGFTQSKKGYLKHSTDSEPKNPYDQANKCDGIDFLHDSLDKNAEMIAKVKACFFKYLHDIFSIFIRKDKRNDKN